MLCAPVELPGRQPESGTRNRYLVCGSRRSNVVARHFEPNDIKRHLLHVEIDVLRDTKDGSVGMLARTGAIPNLLERIAAWNEWVQVECLSRMSQLNVRQSVCE